jgi:hypothetical protein
MTARVTRHNIELLPLLIESSTNLQDPRIQRLGLVQGDYRRARRMPPVPADNAGVLRLFLVRKFQSASAEIVLVNFTIAAPFDGHLQSALGFIRLQKLLEQFDERLFR